MSFSADIQALQRDNIRCFLLSETIDGVFKTTIPLDVDYGALAEVARKHDRIIALTKYGAEFHPMSTIPITPAVLPESLDNTCLGAKSMNVTVSGGVKLLTFLEPKVTSATLDALAARNDILKISIGDRVVYVYQIRQNDSKGGLAHCKRRGLQFTPEARRSQWPTKSTSMKSARNIRKARAVSWLQRQWKKSAK